MCVCVYVYMCIMCIMCAYVYMCTCIRVYVYMCVCVHVYMCMCICVYVYMCMCVFVYMCTYIYIYIYTLESSCPHRAHLILILLHDLGTGTIIQFAGTKKHQNCIWKLCILHKALHHKNKQTHVNMYMYVYVYTHPYTDIRTQTYQNGMRQRNQTFIRKASECTGRPPKTVCNWLPKCTQNNHQKKRHTRTPLRFPKRQRLFGRRLHGGARRHCKILHHKPPGRTKSDTPWHTSSNISSLLDSYFPKEGFGVQSRSLFKQFSQAPAPANVSSIFQ